MMESLEPLFDFLTSAIWQAIAIAVLVIIYRMGLFAKLSEFEFSPSGLKLKLAKIENEQDRLQNEIATLRFLVSGFLTSWEYTHLQKLADDQPFEYEWGGKNDDRFMQELIRMWDFGLIKRGENLQSWYHLPHKGNLHEFCSITKRGRDYLVLRSQIEIDR